MSPQDFVIYPLINSSSVFGRRVDQTESESDSELLNLWAPDLLPRHCLVRRLGVKPVTLLKPLDGAEVKRNGCAVRHEVELRSGDVIGLGHHYLFMYKDPTSEHPTLCQVCVLSEKSRRPRGFQDPEGAELALAYDAEHESRVLELIFSTADQDKDTHKLSAAFLLCLCFQQSVNHFSMPALRRLLLHTANQLQTLVWVSLFSHFNLLHLTSFVSKLCEQKKSPLATSSIYMIFKQDQTTFMNYFTTFV